MDTAWTLIRTHHPESFDELSLRRRLSSTALSPQVVQCLSSSKLAGFVFGKSPDLFRGTSLAADWKQQWIRAQLYLRELQIIDETWGDKEIPVAVLKGCALIGDIYPDAGQRFMSDIDLLLPEEKLSAAIEALELRGYRPSKASSFEADEFKIVLEKTSGAVPVTLELHTRLFYQHDGFHSWQLRPHPQFRHIQALSLEDQLVHLLGHLGYQHTFLMLYWFLDLDLFLRKYGSAVDCGRVEERLRSLHQLRSAKIAFWILERYFHTPLPIDLPRASRGLRWILQRTVTEQFLWSTAKPKFTYLLLKHLSKDRIRDAIIYDWKWLTHDRNR